MQDRSERDAMIARMTDSEIAKMWGRDVEEAIDAASAPQRREIAELRREVAELRSIVARK